MSTTHAPDEPCINCRNRGVVCYPAEAAGPDAGLREALEVEWYDGNMTEGAYDRILEVLAAHRSSEPGHEYHGIPTLHPERLCFCDKPPAPAGPAVPEGEWFEIPDYRAFIEKVAAVLDESATGHDLLMVYDGLANEARSILNESPDPTGEPE